jgi:hypothetical protein
MGDRNRSGVRVRKAVYMVKKSFANLIDQLRNSAALSTALKQTYS